MKQKQALSGDMHPSPLCVSQRCKKEPAQRVGSFAFTGQTGALVHVSVVFPVC